MTARDLAVSTSWAVIDRPYSRIILNSMMAGALYLLFALTQSEVHFRDRVHVAAIALESIGGSCGDVLEGALVISNCCEVQADIKLRVELAFGLISRCSKNLFRSHVSAKHFVNLPHR